MAKQKKQIALQQVFFTQFRQVPWVIYGLILCVLSSSFGVIYVTHQVRSLTASIQELREHQQALDVEWRNLRLEQSALGEHSRIESLAASSLGMNYVTNENERVLQ